MRWARRNVETWLRAIWNLRDVLAEHDLESRATLVFALQFAAFVIFLSVFMYIAAEFAVLGGDFSAVGMMVTGAVVLIVTFLDTIALKIMTMLVRTKRYASALFFRYS